MSKDIQASLPDLEHFQICQAIVISKSTVISFGTRIEVLFVFGAYGKHFVFLPGETYNYEQERMIYDPGFLKIQAFIENLEALGLFAMEPITSTGQDLIYRRVK